MKQTNPTKDSWEEQLSGLLHEYTYQIEKNRPDLSADKYEEILNLISQEIDKARREVYQELYDEILKFGVLNTKEIVYYAKSQGLDIKE